MQHVVERKDLISQTFNEIFSKNEKEIEKQQKKRLAEFRSKVNKTINDKLSDLLKKTEASLSKELQESTSLNKHSAALTDERQRLITRLSVLLPENKFEEAIAKICKETKAQYLPAPPSTSKCVEIKMTLSEFYGVAQADDLDVTASETHTLLKGPR